MRARVGLGLCFAFASCAAGAAFAEPRPASDSRWLEARGLSEAEIGHLAAQLAGPSSPQREAAFRALSSLHRESLPGIAARLRSLRKSRPSPDVAKAGLAAFRHALGSKRADDALDIAEGVLPALAQPHDASLLAMAEPLLLLRSLERLGSAEAGAPMAEVLVLDEAPVWDFELKLSRERAGLRLLPALIALRSHADPRVRAWAQAGVRALGMDDPTAATRLEDPHLVAEVVRAYGQPLDFGAMPVLVRLTSAPQLELREAARETVARFGKNAIWQLRQLYEEVAGKSAERSWDAERTARELYAIFDRATRADEQTLLAQGMARLSAGDLQGMRERYDRLLAQSPHFAEGAKLAPGYSALGKQLLARDQLEAARAAYQRALRLSGDAADAEKIRGELAFIDAEIALSHGVVDLDGYAEALRHAPAHARAAEAKDRLSGEHAARARRHKRVAACAAIALLLGVIALLWRGRGARAGRDRAADAAGAS